MKALAMLLMVFALQQAAAQSIEAARHSRPLAMGSLPPTEISDDVQRLFFKQQWVPGTVLLKNNNTPLHFPLLFDVYSNQLYYQKAGLVMEFLDPVEEFTMRIMRKNDSIDLLFRRGYPQFQKNTEVTYYEVLVDGDYQLLRCKAKSIYLVKEELPEEQRTYQKELLFAFLPGDKLVQVKKDKAFLLAQMPEAAAAIEQIAAQHKLKLKNEEQLVRLFTLLNKAG